jgi:hypothetical protein
VRQSLASKGKTMESKEATALEAVNRRQPVTIQQTEEFVRAVVNCRGCELALAL